MAKGKYAAKLLFQYRIIKKKPSRKRLCEEGIFQFEASSPKHAIKKAKSIGKAAEYTFVNVDRHQVLFEFVGILELRSMGAELESHQVWYDYKELVQPMERNKKLIPREEKLAVIRESQQEISRSNKK
jgi:hypothetical protein